MGSKNKCSLKVVKDGNVLSGTAAVLHATSRAGGYDAYMTKFAADVAADAVKKHTEMQLSQAAATKKTSRSSSKTNLH